MTKEEIKNVQLGQSIRIAGRATAIIRAIDTNEEMVTLEVPPGVPATMAKSAETDFMVIPPVRSVNLPVEEPPDARPLGSLMETKTTVICSWHELANACVE
jgi:hypothetical protein